MRVTGNHMPNSDNRDFTHSENASYVKRFPEAVRMRASSNIQRARLLVAASIRGVRAIQALGRKARALALKDNGGRRCDVGW